jgi:ribosomal protein L29
MFPSESSAQSTGNRSPEKSPRGSRRGSSASTGFTSYSKDELQSQLDELKQQLTEINARRQIQETELSSLNNVVFRQRLESVLNKLVNDQLEKESQIEDVEALIAQHEDGN